jgi:hypothetical protein
VNGHQLSLIEVAWMTGSDGQRSFRSAPWEAQTGHLQTVSVAAQFVRKRSFRIDPIHREHSWRGRDSGVEMKV